MEGDVLVILSLLLAAEDVISLALDIAVGFVDV